MTQDLSVLFLTMACESTIISKQKKVNFLKCPFIILTTQIFLKFMSFMGLETDYKQLLKAN